MESHTKWHWQRQIGKEGSLGRENQNYWRCAQFRETQRWVEIQSFKGSSTQVAGSSTQSKIRARSNLTI
jgi:hypothetical protein